MNYCQKIIKKHFNKNFVMFSKDEQRFPSGNKCWIYNKLVDVEDNKVRDHCHITGKYRGSARLKLTKNVLVIFYNSKGMKVI